MTHRPKNPLTEELFDVLEGVGITPTINGRPVNRDEFKAEMATRAETKIKTWLERLVETYFRAPPSSSDPGRGPDGR